MPTPGPAQELKELRAWHEALAQWCNESELGALIDRLASGDGTDQDAAALRAAIGDLYGTTRQARHDTDLANQANTRLRQQAKTIQADATRQTRQQIYRTVSHAMDHHRQQTQHLLRALSLRDIHTEPLAAQARALLHKLDQAPDGTIEQILDDMRAAHDQVMRHKTALWNALERHGLLADLTTPHPRTLVGPCPRECNSGRARGGCQHDGCEGRR